MQVFHCLVNQPNCQCKFSERPILLLWMHSFGMIWIRISDPRSLGSWCIKGTDESLTRVDSSVSLMHHEPSDLGSLIRVQIIPEERTLLLIATFYSLWNVKSWKPFLCNIGILAMKVVSPSMHGPDMQVQFVTACKSVWPRFCRHGNYRVWCRL